MKNVLRFALGLAVVAGLAASLMPSQAACNAARVISTVGAGGNSYIYTPGNPFAAGCGGTFGSNGGLQPCGGTASYYLNGFFWAWGGGNPTSGLGHDSGTNKGQYYSNWLLPKYAGVPALIGGVYSHWQFPGTDGCVDQTGSSSGTSGLPDANECMVIVLNDLAGPNGYFLAMSAPPNQGFDFVFNAGAGFPTQLNLVPIPKPFVNSSSLGGGIATLNVSLPIGTLTRANGFDFKCHAAQGEILTGWKLYFRKYPSNNNGTPGNPNDDAPEPASYQSRAILPLTNTFAPPGPPGPPWTLASGATPIGPAASTSIQVPCTANEEIALCATLTFGGPSNEPAAVNTPWELKFCSASRRVTCNPTLADPEDKKLQRHDRTDKPVVREKKSGR
jgi:hypothetical protein